MKAKIWGLLGVILFIFILWRIDLISLINQIKDVNLFLFIVSFLFMVFAIVIKAIRWNYINKQAGVKLSMFSAISIWFKALFAENTPGKLGELFVRSDFTKKEAETSFGKALFPVTFDRIIEVLSIIFGSIIGLLVLMVLFEPTFSIVVPVVFFLMSLAFMWWLRKKDVAVKLLRPFYKLLIPKKFKNKIKFLFDEFYEGVKKLNIGVVFYSLIFSAIAIVVMGFNLWFLALALNLEIPLWYMVLCVPINTLILTLPISVQGLGTREASFIFLFGIIGISAEVAVGFSILSLIQRLVLVVPGLIMIFVLKKAKTHK